MNDDQLELEYRVALWEVAFLIVGTAAIGFLIGIGLAL